MSRGKPVRRGSRSNDIVKTVLPNGLVVILKEDHSNPVVAINVWYRVGSAHETDDTSGLAHFQEHMVFKGTDKYGVGEIADAVKSAGGDLNAGTSYSYTSYYVVLPSRSFSLGLSVQADAMMNSTFDPEEFNKERLVVIEEARMYDDTPEAYAYYRTMELGFLAHGYRRPIAGYEGVVSRFTRERLFDFYRTYYRPGNAVLVVVGDVDGESAMKEIERIYGPWSGVRVDPPECSHEPVQDAFRFESRRGTIDHAYLRFGFHVPNIVDPDYPALEVLAALLGHGKSSRLYQRVREEKRLVTTASAGLLAEKWPGYFMVSASTPAEKWEQARDAVFAEVTRFAAEPVTEEELQKTRRQVEKARYGELETVEGQASELGYYEVMGDYRLAEEYREAIHRVTARDVMSAAGKYLTLDNCSLVSYLPRTLSVADPSRERVESALRESVSSAPQPRRSGPRETKRVTRRRPLSKEREKTKHGTSRGKGEVERFTLVNGVRVLCRRRTTVPLVSVLSVCQGGARSEPKGKSGLSLLSMRALLKGTESFAADQIVETIENLGGNIESFSGFDLSGVYVSLLRDHLRDAVRVYRDVLRHPSFVAERLEQERKRLLEELAKRRDHPVLYTVDQLFAKVFGNHPYAHPFLGDESQLALLAESDCAEWYRSVLVPENTVVVFVGDVTPDEAVGIAGELFGDLEARPVSSQIIEPCLEPVSPGVHEFTKENLNQAVGIVGFLAPPMLTREAVSLRVLDGLMTGLGGRLFVELRDKRSLGYMAGSAFMPLKERSVFYGYSNPKPEGVDEAVEVILGELEKVTREHVEDSELARSKEWLAGSQMIKLQRNLAQAIEYGYYEVLGFGYEMVERVPDMIRHVTKEDIRQAATQVFDRTKAVCVKLVPR